MNDNTYRIIFMLFLAISSFTLNYFLPSIHVVTWYLISINLFTFFVFMIDKYHAKKDRKRTSEMTLHLFSLAGGIFGAITAMIIFKHKTNKKLFLTYQGIITLLWIVFLYYILLHLQTI